MVEVENVVGATRSLHIFLLEAYARRFRMGIGYDILLVHYCAGEKILL
jgi:hypothetical protein